MFCPKCGAELPNGAAFCTSCGVQLNSDTVTQNATRKINASVPGDVVSTPQVTVKKQSFLVPIIAVVALIGLVVAGILTGGFGLLGPHIEINDKVDDYTWEELSQISELISKSGSEEKAIEIAKRYHLCNEDGTLDGTQTKHVEVSGASRTEVQIIGFYHDDKSDGSGKAGITFLFTDLIFSSSMNRSDSNAGGWSESKERNQLEQSMEDILPMELLDVVVPVNKLTNNKGMTREDSSVSVTSDLFWLISYNEITGPITEDIFNESGSNRSWDDKDVSYGDTTPGDYGPEDLFGLLSLEGTQYKLFSDSDLKWYRDNPVLTKGYPYDSPSEWWLRSPLPLCNDRFMSVTSTGRPGPDDDPSNFLGIVPGFCI